LHSSYHGECSLFFWAESCFLTLYFIAGNNHSCTH
jgi:hypothetical protein